MPNRLKEKIRKDNGLINFLKIPKELIEEKYPQKNLMELDEKIAYYLTEEYTDDHNQSRLKSILKDTFYKIKPIIPRRIQIELRRKYMLFQKKTQFPSWPIDLSLYDTYKNGIKEIFKLANLNEIPFINFWPNNKRFTFVLTHDVETGIGQKNIWKIKEIEEELGFCSSWNFVPERYKVDERLIKKLKNSGFEIGIHGLKHDVKLFKNRKIFLKKVPKINYYLKKYNCLGFRSPMTLRNYEYMQNLNIKYDLSFFDSDIFEGQAGGTLSFHPFILGKFVELPYTLPQDFTLFILLGEKDDRIWENKMKVIKQFHGMVLMNTHPDYLIKKDLLKIYQEFLIKIKKVLDYWHALPKEVAEWWICRSKCVLKRSGDHWEIYPPLKEASIGTIRIEKGECIFS
jgi:hypothetical protein